MQVLRDMNKISRSIDRDNYSLIKFVKALINLSTKNHVVSDGCFRGISLKRKKCLIHRSLIHCRRDKFSCWGYVALARNSTCEGDACHETCTANDQATICAKSVTKSRGNDCVKEGQGQGAYAY